MSEKSSADQMIDDISGSKNRNERAWAVTSGVAAEATVQYISDSYITNLLI